MRSLRAFGFLAIFAPLVLLIVGNTVDKDWLLTGAYFVAFPLLRFIFGSQKEGGVDDWSSAEKALLRLLPRLYVAAFVATFGWVLWVVATAPHEFTLSSVPFMVSTLVMAGLAACVAHDLAHRSNAWERRSSQLLSALVGYPFFTFEHLEHHKQSANTETADCPRWHENVWSYCGRRFVMVPLQVCRRAFTSWDTTPSRPLDRVWIYIAITLATWGAFAVLGGWYGAVFYAVLIGGVPFLLNAITYIQHWGLGDDGPASAARLGHEQVGWDDGCRFQSWVILNISFHSQHHAKPSAPFYTYGPSPGSPKLPAEYAVMVLVCFVPSLWRRVMTPALTSWHLAVAGHVG